MEQTTSALPTIRQVSSDLRVPQAVDPYQQPQRARTVIHDCHACPEMIVLRASFSMDTKEHTAQLPCGLPHQTYPDCVGAPQTIAIRTQPKRRLWLKGTIFAILLLAIGSYIAVREWDAYSPYSGVVIEKGMDCNLCFLGRSHSLALYLILRDDLGRRSKRYVGSSFSYTDTKRWNEIGVGSFIVKDKGYSEHPYEPGKKPVSPPYAKGDGWILLSIVLICGTLLAVKLRQFWNAL